MMQDEPIMMIDVESSKAYYYHCDGLGSVIALSDSAGRTVEMYEYDVYGNTIILAPTQEPPDTSLYGNPYMFTGRRFDTETGLYYYRARYYSTEIGRFLQVDPIGYADSMNLYIYVGNNPLNWVDSYGLCKGMGDRMWDATKNAYKGVFKEGWETYWDLIESMKRLPELPPKLAAKAWQQYWQVVADTMGSNYYPHTGVSAHYSTINPGTSRGGSVRGYHEMYFTTNKSGQYNFSTSPPGTGGVGLDVGAGAEFVFAWGSGEYAGKFDAIVLSAGIIPVTASIFWSADKGSNYIGFTVGPNVGLPGFAYERTEYGP